MTESENAPVTRRDRERAYACVRDGAPYPSEQRWIETGEGFANRGLNQISRALADERAEAEHRAWNEGARCGIDGENPYREPSK